MSGCCKDIPQEKTEEPEKIIVQDLRISGKQLESL